ncbi:MAG: leucyl aminopeptidase [Planctomycetes bacterium]|nr:leucyl aminopeptidase [Planctomycetota bacterium]
MKCVVENGGKWKADGRTLVMFGTSDPSLAAGSWPGMTKRDAEALLSLAREDGWAGKEEEVLVLRPQGGRPALRVALAGLGTAEDAGPDRVRRAAAAAVKRLRDYPVERLYMLLPASEGGNEERAAAIVEGALLASYRFDRHKSSVETKHPPLSDLRLVPTSEKAAAAARAGCARGRVLAEAISTTRDLVNEPAADKTPTRIAAEVRRLGRKDGLKVRVLRENDLRKLGMGSLLAVAQGSYEPPTFVTLQYDPPGKPRKRIALVGKGITFDSGGLCIKTADGMETMKCDMGGAATIFGVMRALPKLKPAVSVLACLPFAENMPGGRAVKPGDVFRAMNGKTIEMKNTDAEGRLVLADGLAYAVKAGVDEIVDVATLTGACVVALGPLVSGVFSNHQPLADRLLAAAREAGEYAWQLPLIKEYRELMKSTVADLKNSEKPHGGAIKAALFLQEFVGDVPWAHVDIAGPAYSDRELPLGRSGGTGHLVRTLLAFLEREGRK